MTVNDTQNQRISRIFTIIPVLIASIFLGGYLLLMTLVHTGILNPFPRPEAVDMNDPVMLKRLEQTIGFEFPPSVSWENAMIDRWLEEEFHCRFTIPKADLDLLFPAGKIKWVENDRSLLPSTRSKDRWFSPESLSDFKAFSKEQLDETHSQPHHDFRVFVDNSVKKENERVTVYLMYFD